MIYLLDTNIIVAYLRSGKVADYLDRVYSPLSLPNTSTVSVVSRGELDSLGLRNNWGRKRRQQLQFLINQFYVIDINAEDIIQRYALIETYSQGKLKSKPLPSRVSARNMSDNDLWIAATASVTNTPLISTDKDFLHLDEVFLKLVWIDIGSI